MTPRNPGASGMSDQDTTQSERPGRAIRARGEWMMIAKIVAWFRSLPQPKCSTPHFILNYDYECPECGTWVRD